jgi:hypothetical protein
MKILNIKIGGKLILLIHNLDIFQLQAFFEIESEKEFQIADP